MESLIVMSLLAIIAISDLLRFIPTRTSVKRNRFFKSRVKEADRLIWEEEFNIFKLRNAREKVRKDRDDRSARLSDLNARITKESEAGGLKETNPDEFKRLEDDKVLLERDITRFENQMDDIDIELNGTDASDKYPDGIIGIDEKIDLYSEAKGLFKKYIKTL